MISTTLLVIMGVVIITSIIFNTLIITSTYTVKRSERTKLMLTKSSLAFLDIFNGLILIAYGLLKDTTCFNVGEYHIQCDDVAINILTTLINFCLASSYLHVCLMSFQMYKAIVHELDYRLVTHKRQFLYILLTYVLGIPISIPVYLVRQSHLSVQILYVNSGLMLGAYSLSVFCTMTVCYVYFRKRIQTSQINQVQRSRNPQRHLKFVLTVTFLVIGYAITTLPYNILYLICGWRCSEQFSLTLRNVFGFLLNCNIFVDILVYSVLDDTFQKHVRSVFSKLLFPCRKLTP